MYFNRSITLAAIAIAVLPAVGWAQAPEQPPRHSAREFASDLKLQVWVQATPTAGCKEIGITSKGKTFTIPDCYQWGIGLHYLSSQEQARAAIDLAKRERIPGLTDTGRWLNDESVPLSRSLANLETLSIEYSDQMTDRGFAVLADLRNLRILCLGNCPRLTDKTLALIAGLPHLRSLDVRWCGKVTDVGLQEICKQGKLILLNVSYCQGITSRGLASLSNLTRLQDLNIDNHRVDSVSMKSIGQLNGLTHLSMADVTFDHEEVLSPLALLSDLRCLRLSGTKITDNTLGLVSKLHGLTELNLHRCDKITDDGLQRIMALGTLRKLDLSHCFAITDGGLSSLSKLENLVSLDLRACHRVGDTSLAQIARLKNLRELSLRDCPKLTADGLKLLGDLRGLKVLFIERDSGKHWNHEDIASLKKKLPDCQIHDQYPMP